MTKFCYTFKVGKKTIFRVSNDEYFATGAAVFNRNNTDFDRCGQCQADVLTGHALAFWQKWDHLHLQRLSPEQEGGILNDVEQLKRDYPNWIPNDRFSHQQILIKQQ